jgi:hypothetical protein
MRNLLRRGNAKTGASGGAKTVQKRRFENRVAVDGGIRA